MKTQSSFGFLLFGLILFVSCSLYAQKAPDIEWQRCFGGTQEDGASYMILTSDGGYAIAGYTQSDDGEVKGFHPSLDSAHTTGDFWIVKLDVSGVIQWQKCLGGSGDDIASCIIQTSDRGYIVVGHTYSSDGDVTGNNGGSDAWVVKLDSSGNIRWEKCFGASSQTPYRDTYANTIIQSKNGGYIVAGSEVYGNEGCHLGPPPDAIILKLDSAGNPIWQKCFGGTDIDGANSIIQASDGGYAFVGYTESKDGDVSGYHFDSLVAFATRDIWLVKINSSGSLEWQKCLGGYKDDWSGSIIQTDDSAFIIAGITASNDGDVSGNHGRNDAWIVKVSSAGIIEWQKCYGGMFSDGANSIIKTSDGGFVITGTTSSNDGDVSGWHPSVDSTHGRTTDVWVVKLNSSGAVQWQKCLGGAANDAGNSLIQTHDGGYVIAGTTNSNDGDVSGNHGNSDLWVVKLKAPANNVENANPFLGAFNFFSIYPNPSSNEVHLQMWGDQPVQKVKFYDVMGRDVTPPYDLNGNTATVTVHSLTAGIYVARLTFTYNDYTGTFTLPLLVQH
jgi:hypothetical protein